MRLANMTWPKVEEYFKTNDTVMIAIGSIESHGRHMPVGTDTLIPDKILELIEEKNDSIIIAPTIPYGAADVLMGYPGTITLGLDILYQVLNAIVNSLWEHGARKFIILNGHGGNIKTIERVGLELVAKGGLLACLNWWLMAWDLNPAWTGGHGGGEETAGVLAVDPSLVDRSEIGGELVLKDINEDLKATGFSTVEYKGVSVNIMRATDHVTDSGWIGKDHPNTATEEWGKEMLQATADYIADFIDVFKKVEV